MAYDTQVRRPAQVVKVYLLLSYGEMGYFVAKKRQQQSCMTAAFSIPENRLESGFSAVRAHKRTPLQAILRRGFVRFRRIVAFCAVVIVKQLG